MAVNTGQVVGRRGHNGGRSEYNYDNLVAQHSLSHDNPEHAENITAL